MLYELKRKVRKLVDIMYGRFNLVFLPIIIIICTISLAIGIYVENYCIDISEDPLVIGKNTNTKDSDVIEFENLFNNEIKGSLSGFINSSITSKDNVVSTAYDLNKTDEVLYDVNVKIPQININDPIFDEINAEIKKDYYDKAYSIMRNSTGNTIFSVNYEAYIYDNILSLVIKSSLKENEQSEKLAIKTYVYDLDIFEQLNLEKIIEKNELKKDNIQKKINNFIKEKSKSTRAISKEYKNIVQRDETSDIYKIENNENCFLTDEGKLYIIYAYGNYENTNEIDVLSF